MSKTELSETKDAAQIKRFRKSQQIYDDREYMAGKNCGTAFAAKAEMEELIFLSAVSEVTLLDPRFCWPFDIERCLRRQGLQVQNQAFLRGFIHGARERTELAPALA